MGAVPAVVLAGRQKRNRKKDYQEEIVDEFYGDGFGDKPGDLLQIDKTSFSLRILHFD